MRNIILYGDLSKKYGKKHRYDVKSIWEALRALEANNTGFLNSIKKDGYYEVVRGNTLNGEHLTDKDELLIEYGKGDFHISPCIEGAGGDVLTTMLGVTLVVVGCLVSPVSPYLITTGTAMIIGGISSMMMSSPSGSPYEDREKPDERPSFFFRGPTNTMEQGGVLPLVYGRMVVGSCVVNAGIEIENIEESGFISTCSGVENLYGEEPGTPTYPDFWIYWDDYTCFAPEKYKIEILKPDDTLLRTEYILESKYNYHVLYNYTDADQIDDGEEWYTIVKFNVYAQDIHENLSPIATITLEQDGV